MNYTINLAGISNFMITYGTESPCTISKASLWERSGSEIFFMDLRQECEQKLGIPLEELLKKGTSLDWVNDYMLACWLAHHDTEIHNPIESSIVVKNKKTVIMSIQSQDVDGSVFVLAPNRLDIIYDYQLYHDHYRIMYQFTPLWAHVIHNNIEALQIWLKMTPDIMAINTSLGASQPLEDECVLHI